jgi:hypothetical protein
VWNDYFTGMYSIETDIDDNYDNDHCTYVNNRLRFLKEFSKYETDSVIVETFTPEEVEGEVRKLKYAKKGGFDGISNEHLKYGKNNLMHSLANLFNAMYAREYVPIDMKKGLIYTLYKGSKKYMDDRKNYRGITLLPVIGKLFDRIILKRLKSWFTRENINFPSSNQNAYQESLCSVLASFQVQETIHFNFERGSKTYLALLDSSSAFDLVWHSGLFVKMHAMGVKWKLWRMSFQLSQYDIQCSFIRNN